MSEEVRDRIDPVTGAKTGEMSEHQTGLLGKAAEQQSQVFVLAEESPDEPSEIRTGGGTGIAEAAKTLLLFGIVPIAIVRWFEVYLDFIPFMMQITIIATFAAIWWKLGIGIPAFAGGSGVSPILAGLVGGSYILLLIIPLILGIALEGELSLGEVEYSDDGEQITVKLRQNTISDKAVEAEVSIKQSGVEIWGSEVSLSIDKSDGRGDYGAFTLDVIDFYVANALPDSPYSLVITVDGKEMTRQLDAATLTRTISGVEGSTSGIVKNEPDRCSGDSENCLVGVAMTAWAGLDVGSDKPGGMQFADFTVNATLMEGNEVAVSYPTITVVNTKATWNSNNDEFGNGMGTWGDFGSEFGLDGSVVDPSFGVYIPKENFDSAGDYGCYSFTIEVSQEGDSVISHTSYYEYSSSNSNDIWSPVSSC